MTGHVGGRPGNILRYRVDFLTQRTNLDYSGEYNSTELKQGTLYGKILEGVTGSL